MTVSTSSTSRAELSGKKQSDFESGRDTTFLRSLRLSYRDIFPIAALFFVVLLVWGIAEIATSTFRTTIEDRLRNVVASDTSVTARSYPDEASRKELEKVAAEYGAKTSESVSLPYTLSYTGASGVIEFVASELRIIDRSYPLYGTMVYSGAFAGGAIASPDILEKLGTMGFSIQDVRIPVLGSIVEVPWLTPNPFAPNRDIIVSDQVLPFSTVTASGAGYRVSYRMDFAVEPERRAEFITELKKRFESNPASIFQVRESSSRGGQFGDISDTFSTFLASILYAATLISIASFLVAFARFVSDRKKMLATLWLIGRRETRSIQLVLVRIGTMFIGAGLIYIGIFSVVPLVTMEEIWRALSLVFLLAAIGGYMTLWILFSESWLVRTHRGYVQWGGGIVILSLFSIYVLLSGNGTLPIVYAVVAILVLERLSTLLFLGASLIASRIRMNFRSKFFLMDAFRSFQKSPILGKIAFSVFFIIAALLSSVAIFTLTFRTTLNETMESKIDAFVINLLPRDYENLSKWVPKEDFYSTLRARIVRINTVSLADHLGGGEVSWEFTREFNITDMPTDNALVLGRWVNPKSREVTVDEEFSKRIGIGMGDTIEFSISGRSFEFSVVGIRESRRSGITPFFYFQIPEWAIAWAPKTYFLATKNQWSSADFKARILAETGNHISFIEVESILRTVREYASSVLAGVLALFAYIGFVGVLAFLVTEQSFFRSKLRKIRLYRVIGLSNTDAFSLLFFESMLGNIIPMMIGATVGIIGFWIFSLDRSILNIQGVDIVVVFLVMLMLFFLAYQYAKRTVSTYIKKTDPAVGSVL